MDLSNEHASRARRYVEVAAFVAVWMICGWAASLDANAYLLLGVPLVLLFQRFVAKRPLAALWVQTADRVALGPRDIFIACLLMILPGWVFVTQALPEHEWTIALWYACAMAGTLGVGFALQRQQRLGVRRAFPFAMGAFAWGCGMFALQAMALHRTPFPEVAKLLPFLRQFLIYLPAVFVLEEVAFRGALDSHVAPLASKNRRSWLSALFVAALWGLWHFPIGPPGTQNAVGVVSLLLVHVPIGMLLAYTWRKSGTLLLPAIVHSAVDAYRNVIAG